MDVVKEKLVAEKENINEAFLKLKQCYNASPDAKELYFLVEGPDDSVYYYTKATQALTDTLNIRLIIAGNRKKVVEAYQAINWKDFLPFRVLFFVDRDLSDFTGEYTPIADNVYVTDKYSIENDYCSKLAFIKTIKVFGGLIDIDSLDEEALLRFYDDSLKFFYSYMTPLMGRILYWRKSGIKCNLNNINCRNLFHFDNCILTLKSEYSVEEDRFKYLHSNCSVFYEVMSTNDSVLELCKRTTPDVFTRGKQIAQFFCYIVNYVFINAHLIIPSRRSAKPSITLGEKNFVSQLVSVMQIPITLSNFIESNSKVYGEFLLNEVG